MNDISTESFSPDEQILAEFILELERVGAEDFQIDPWIEKYPHLEQRFRDDLKMFLGLEQSRPEIEPSLPKQLGEFRVVRKLARGGMGEVYEAVQEPLGRRVAVKTIRREHFSSNSQARFLREQKVLARLHQTHIVPIHTAGREEELQYFAMPFIKGAALHDVIHTVSDFTASHPSHKTPPLGRLAEAAGSNQSGILSDTMTPERADAAEKTPSVKNPPHTTKNEHSQSNTSVR